MIVSAIAAMSENRVIGKNNLIPWSLPPDMRRFRELTKGNPVVMGRKTFESLGKPLPERENVVLTRQKGLKIPGTRVVATMDEALKPYRETLQEIFVIGGEEIYKLAMPFTQRIYLTIIHRRFEGDAFFPEMPEGFREISREDFKEPMPFSYFLYERQ